MRRPWDEREELRVDAGYLRDEAYRDTGKLDARIALHRRFSLNPQPWWRWVFERLELQPGGRVLDVGCGRGDLWHENLDRLDPSCELTLVDLSTGMVDAARARLGERASYAVADAHDLPFPDGSFDVALANHMLYHLADLPRALAELARVLRTGGRLYATTVGERHLAELREIVYGVQPLAPWSRNHVRFGLDNAAERLRPAFEPIGSEDYPDGFRVTEVEPVVDYLLSTTTARALSAADVDEVRARVAAIVERDGAFALTKRTGLVSAAAA